MRILTRESPVTGGPSGDRFQCLNGIHADSNKGWWVVAHYFNGSGRLNYTCFNA
jgi:hypothetical protein